MDLATGIPNPIDVYKKQPDALPVPPPVNVSMASAPVLPVPTAPLVLQAPHIPTQLETLQSRRNADVNAGSGIDQIHNPFIRGLARTADVLGSVFTPNLAMAIPGTTLHHEMLVNRENAKINQLENEQKEQAGVTEAGARASLDTANAAHLNAEIPLVQEQTKAAQMANTAAQLGAARAANEGTLVRDGYGRPIAWQDVQGHTYPAGDPNIPAGIAATMQADPGKPPTSEFELWQRQNPGKTTADYQQVLSKPLSQAEADSLNAVWNPLALKHHLPTGQFAAGMPHADATALSAALNNAIGKAQGETRITLDFSKFNAGNGLNLNDPAMQAAINGVANGSMKLTDVFGRGATLQQKAAFAAEVKKVNPNWNSGDNAIENRLREFMISGQGGQTLTAGNTLTHHLDLYDRAVDAVNNGDVKALNKIGNELGIQMGNDAQTNLALIRQGVAMEAARFWTGGVPGEAEINQFNQSLSGDGSPKQMHGGANTIRAMAQGKLQGLQGQYSSGQKGEPNFGNTPTPSSHTFSLSAWQRANPNGDVNAAKAAAKQQGYQVVQ